MKEQLMETAKKLEEKHEFKVGDLVQWKPGLKNKKYPKDGCLGVVTKVLAVPMIDQENSPGSPYFQEPLDIVVGTIDPSDDEFLEYHSDSRRFEPVAE